MADQPTPDAETQTADIEQITRKVNFLERVVLILVLAVLGISVCLNVYKYYENLVQQRQLGYLRQERYQYAELQQFTQKLVVEMHGLGRTNKDVRDLLIKYRPTLEAFRLVPQGALDPNPSPPPP